MLSPNKEVENNMCMHLDSITSHDSTNREGMSAKIYFKQIFGKEFVREEDNEINWKLNYAYSILLSMFNRSIISKGYLLEIGIFHKGQQNNFNLSCDLIEPFRPIVDYFVIAEFIDRKFDRDCRMDMINIFNNKIKINNKRHYFTNAVEIYLQSVFDKLNEEASCIYKPEICFEL